MTTQTFEAIRQIVYDRSGISLNQNKESLVRARIAKRMRKLNLDDYSAYLEYVIDDQDGTEIQEMLDAISTNTTSFYREADHFDLIRKLVRGWVDSGARTLRFWSAASSTGEEPYTLAIELKETFGPIPIDAKILATDINSSVLRDAQAGRYTEDKVEPVPKFLRNKYFTKEKHGSEHIYVVKDSLKEMILFRQFNLSTQPYPIKRALDLIMCRNVMIYFDGGLRRKMALEFERLLKPGGYLLIGHAESLTGMAKKLKCIKPSIYVKG